ncbi:MAG TPA: autoinducer 2 ABC transporter substrate-binding protein [Aggregatilineales bacterium]|jgi:simple sugar transport system substrate-binding protein|nr:autoinducer 2 ABC transporter substrate-binding protein [Aggregatilineales bacterium]HQA66871.1 autoinducer 2 ABC transporter substrate-binding protein [Aggregatilineales bacterium]HQE17476.1 autoinducer 2 ABC transporter substrate-binding protein [Aggregatilineales bacterium]
MKRILTIFAILLMAAALLAACAPQQPAAEEPAAEEPAAEEPAAEEPAEEPAAEEPAEEEPAAEEPAASAAGSPADLVEDIQEGLVASCGDEEYTFATVVKLTGVGWFDRMEVGVRQFNEDYPCVTAFQQGPAQADAALQVQVIQDLIAQGVDAINVVPFQPEALEPVLESAMNEGITVISHEASNQQNVHYDIEAFDNEAYGEHFMEALAQCMGGEGQYVVFVGSLTSATHNQWVDAAIAYQKANYPNMELVGSKNESYDDAQTAYERMQELLVAYPDLKGMQGSSANDVVGAGQAVEEAGLNDQVCVIGTSTPSMAGALLETGAVDMIGFWDPALAGYAMNTFALMVAQGIEPEEGMNLGIPGYESITSPDGKVWYGQAWIDVTAENHEEWDF